MRGRHQIAALCFLAFSAYLMWESWTKMEYYTPLGPGTGFFPFWLGAALGVLAIVWLLQVSMRSGMTEDGPRLPPKDGMWRILSIVASLFLVSLFITPLGYQLTMFLFMIFALSVLGRQTLWLTLILALVCSTGVFHLFVRYLDVQLPAASWEFLAAIGL